MSGAVAEALVDIAMTCADLDRTERFYTALGFVAAGRRRIEDPAWHHLRGTTGRSAVCLDMALGEEAVTFIAFDPPGRPYPEGSTSTDGWFQHIAIVVDDIAAAYARLCELPFTPVSRNGPETLPPATGGVAAYKFRDPDGHPLEFLHFPAGVGDARWQGPGSLFKGIDHSAIVVRDAAAATRFYSGTLGLAPGRTTLNHGPAQTGLDDVDRDLVDVVPLAPTRGTPHVELLGYRTGLRRPMPADTGPADIAVTWLTFRAASLDRLDPSGLAMRQATLADGSAAVALADKDGHRLLLVQPASPASNNGKSSIIAKI